MMQEVVMKRLRRIERDALAQLGDAGFKPNVLESIAGGFVPMDLLDESKSRSQKKKLRLVALCIAAQSAHAALEAIDNDDVWRALDKAISATTFLLGPDSTIGESQRKAGTTPKRSATTKAALAYMAKLPTELSTYEKAKRAEVVTGAKFDTIKKAIRGKQA